jgi:hypothetical protein
MALFEGTTFSQRQMVWILGVAGVVLALALVATWYSKPVSQTNTETNTETTNELIATPPTKPVEPELPPEVIEAAGHESAPVSAKPVEPTVVEAQGSGQTATPPSVPVEPDLE